MSSNFIAQPLVSEDGSPATDPTVVVRVFNKNELPNIQSQLTPYTMRTLEMIHQIHSPSEITYFLCQAIAFRGFHPNMPKCNTSPTVEPEKYEQSVFTKMYPAPRYLPFLGDECGVIISAERIGTVQPGKDGNIMEVVVEAMRHTTKLIRSDNTSAAGPSYEFVLPTSEDIMKHMTSIDAAKYPESAASAHGWRNSVNQCLTAGQGINFLSYGVPRDRNHRYILLERAFNGSIILGSGKCRAINDLKPKKARRTSIVQATPPPELPQALPQQMVFPPAPLPTHTLQDPQLSDQRWVYTALAETAPDTLSSVRQDPADGEQQAEVQRGRCIVDIEKDLMSGLAWYQNLIK